MNQALSAALEALVGLIFTAAVARFYSHYQRLRRDVLDGRSLSFGETVHLFRHGRAITERHVRSLLKAQRHDELNRYLNFAGYSGVIAMNVSATIFASGLVLTALQNALPRVPAIGPWLIGAGALYFGLAAVALRPLNAIAQFELVPAERRTMREMLGERLRSQAETMEHRMNFQEEV